MHSDDSRLVPDRLIDLFLPVISHGYRLAAVDASNIEHIALQVRHILKPLTAFAVDIQFLERFIEWCHASAFVADILSDLWFGIKSMDRPTLPALNVEEAAVVI